MKKRFYAILTLACLFMISGNVKAQIELPRPSPNASVSQDIGLTNVKIDYSAPGVKGRTIWGDLVPFDEPWRAGANSATKITFSKDVTIGGGNKVEAGTYSLFITPSETENWKVHISKGSSVFDYQMESGAYDMNKLVADDVATISARPVMVGDNWERLSFFINPGDCNEGMIYMRWEKAMLGIDIQVTTKEHAMENIAKHLGGWYTYSSSAEYYVDNASLLEEGDLAKANAWADMGIELRDHFFAYWVKAKVAKAMDDNKSALKHAKLALEKGIEADSGFFKSRKEAMEEFIADLD